METVQPVTDLEFFVAIVVDPSLNYSVRFSVSRAYIEWWDDSEKYLVCVISEKT